MEELRDQVLSHTSRQRVPWRARVAGWWRELALVPRLAFATAAVALLVAAAVLVTPPKPAGALRLAGDGANTEIRRAGKSVSVATGGELLAGDEIHAGAGAVTLRFEHEATTITLEPETTVIVRSLVPQKKFELLQGSLSSEVAEQTQGAMVWTTDNAEARVLGTKFALAADGVFTRLDVEKGAVELQRRGSPEQTVVRAGQFAAADSHRLLEAQSRQAEPVWNVPGREMPGFVHTSFVSGVGGMEMGVNVLLPPRYDEFPNSRFPVLYFLHDTGGDEHTEAARFGPLLRAAMARRDLPPFIAVFPNVGPGHTPKPWVMGAVLARDLTRFIDERYRTIPSRSTRTVCGIGQGGYRALMLAMINSPLFGAGGVFDDPLHGGTPGLRQLLERMQARAPRPDRRVLLLHSAAYAMADAGTLGGFLQTLGTTVDARALSAPSPQHPAYAGAVWNELHPWLAAQWKPGRPR